MSLLPHPTLVMNEFIKLENFLLTLDIDDRTLYNYITKQAGSKKLEPIELEYFFNPIQNNLALLTQMSSVLETQYFNNLPYTTTKNNEVATIVELINVIRYLGFINSPISCVSELFALGFIRALLDINIKRGGFTEKPEKQGGKTRHEIITSVVYTLRQLITQFELLLKIKISYMSDTRNVVFILLHCLANANILVMKTSTKLDKSEKCVAFADNTIILRQTLPNLGIYTQPQKIGLINNNLVYTSKHYSGLKSIIHKNKASHSVPRLANLEFVEKRSALRLFVNGRLLRRFKELVLSWYGLAHTMTEEDFLNYLERLKLNLGKKSTQSEFNHLFFLKNVYVLERHYSDFHMGLFFAYYFDFRGRIYTDSSIGYTHNKFFRHIYNYGVYSQDEIFDWESSYNFDKAAYYERILQSTQLVRNYPNIAYHRTIVKYYLVTVFFEIGKVFKSAHIASYNGRISEKDFIEIGIDYYNKQQSIKIELEKQLEFEALIDILHNLNDGIYCKTPIFKDATASAIQILMLLLGSQDPKNYAICNLTDSHYWYDTYFFIIDRFLNLHQVSDEYKQKYFTRSNLKKTIMTYNYEATYRTCWQDFARNAQLWPLTPREQYIKIEQIFRLFYAYLTNIFDKKEFFSMPSKEILNVFKERGTAEQKLEFITRDEFTLHYDYCKLIKQRLDRIINHQRESIQGNIKSDDIDTQKMFRALRANLIHSFDGFLVRVITLRLNYPIITIHDSFGIDILSINRLQDVAQAELQKIFDEDFFKLHIKKSKLNVTSTYIFL